MPKRFYKMMTLCVLYSFIEAADTVLYSCVQSCTVHTAQLSCESARGRVQSCRAQRTPSRPAELDTRQQEPGRFEQSRTSLSQCQHQCHLQHWQLRTAQPWHQKLVFSEVKWASSDECEQEVGDHHQRIPKWLQDCLVSFEGCVLHSWFSASAS